MKNRRQGVIIEQNNRFEGLTREEVEQRVQAGLVNITEEKTGKSIKEIIASNTLTYFNLIFLIISVLLCMVGSFRNLTFLPVIIGNTLIGIVQEIRAKKILEKMTLLNAPHAVVLREGKRYKIASEELVKDDIVIFSAGNQICADARVLSGSMMVNEALLTGEEDEIKKCENDTLMSGSFVVSGECYAVLERVGAQSYISKLSAEAKKLDGKEQSEMIRAINKIILWMGIIVIPIGTVLMYQSYWINRITFKESVVSMVAAIIGMIPEGLYLLTTVALALGTIRLAQKKVLLNDMKSIETLARVDVLCVDKTGTITEPIMEVEELIPFEENEKQLPASFKTMLCAYAAMSTDNNGTMEALKEFCGKMEQSQSAFPKRLQVYPFSSSVKYGAVTFENGTWILGAPEFILSEAREDNQREEVLTNAKSYAKKGYRVLLFAYQKEKLSEEGVSKKAVPVGMIALSNVIRSNAKETFQYFDEQDVVIKVISGDNPETVSEVARRAGIKNSDNFVDATTLETSKQIEEAANIYTVFGRVTPKQKQQLVHALQNAGHTVAMTGDGVNDILAMKDADCSIAMASGSEAVSQAAQVVLMDSDFAHMPNVVLEGRRVVNNIQRSASLFLVKNIFSVLLAIFSSILLFTYPLEPSQISLISMFTIGIPGFFLALETNKNRIEGNFLRNVLMKALPAGLTDFAIVAALVVCGKLFHLPEDDVATAATLLLAVVGFMILRKISLPYNPYRVFVFILNLIGIIACGLFLPDLFAISGMYRNSIVLTIIFAFAAESSFRNITWHFERAEVYFKNKKEKRAIKKAEKREKKELKNSTR